MFSFFPSIAMATGDLITTSLFTMFKENVMFCVFFALLLLLSSFHLNCSFDINSKTKLSKSKRPFLLWQHIEFERWRLSIHKLFTKNEAIQFFYEISNISFISIFPFLFLWFVGFNSLFLLFGVRFSLRLDIYRNHIGLRSVVNVFR